MLQKIKDPSRYIGRKVVLWDGNLKKRPQKCRIVEYAEKSTYSAKKEKDQVVSGVTIDERFTLQDRFGYAIYNVSRDELWKNFTDVYKYIVGHYTVDELQNPSNYSNTDNEALCQLNKLCSNIGVSISSRRQGNFEKELKRLKNLLKTSTETINKFSKPSISKEELMKHSCWGFICELSKRRPDIKIEYRGGEISGYALQLRENQ